MPAGGLTGPTASDGVGFWWVRFLQEISTRYKVVIYLDFFFKGWCQGVKVVLLFFLKERHAKKNVPTFFFTNKQMDHHPIQLVGGGGKISVALLFGIFLKLPAETH